MKKHVLFAAVAVVALMSGRGFALAAPAAPETVAASASAAAAAATATATATATGLSFEQALVMAYDNNPDLNAARAQLRGVDETYAQAKSGFRPVITGEAGYRSTHQEGDTQHTDTDPKNLTVGATQSLYSGGSTLARVDQSEKNIKAQRALLKQKEQQVLLNAITSYLDVVRDQEIVNLNKKNEGVLQKQLEEAKQRFELGDVTKTDVSQAQSRLSAAMADRVRAEGNYKVSRAVFESVIGVAPDGVSQPIVSVSVPANLDDAIRLAQQNNPDIVFADYASQAAADSTRAIWGELLPRVDLSGSVGEVYDPGQSVDDRQTQTAIGITATIPLYSGGGTESRVRQAKQLESQRKLERHQAARTVQQQVIDAWSSLQSSEAEISARKAQVEAAQLALEGVRVETEYGSRTTLDLLDAEQEALNARVAYVSAERNKIASAYRLLSSIGELTAVDLKLPTTVYDPVYNFQKVKDKWVGTGAYELKTQ